MSRLRAREFPGHTMIDNPLLPPPLVLRGRVGVGAQGSGNWGLQIVKCRMQIFGRIPAYILQFAILNLQSSTPNPEPPTSILPPGTRGGGRRALPKFSRMPSRAAMILSIIGMSLLFLRPSQGSGPAPKSSDPKLPTLFLIGDSTVNNGTKGLEGWGSAIGQYFDTSKISVVNDARGGRSSRTFLTEGLWEKVLEKIRPGDFVLMQFGHNDGGGISDPKSRASLKGNGEETQEVTTAAGKKETVRTYGWYLRKYISDAKAKGATPIVLSLIPRNIWKDGKVARSSGDYGKWAAEAAKEESVSFVDLNDIIAKHYEALGEEKVKAFFPQDHTHTNPDGAALNARSVVEGLKGLDGCPLCADLTTAAGSGTEPAASAGKP
jgi:rhamnogalacturonan acetylesterase